jgi:hypothetical protein
MRALRDKTGKDNFPVKDVFNETFNAVVTVCEATIVDLYEPP